MSDCETFVVMFLSLFVICDKYPVWASNNNNMRWKKGINYFGDSMHFKSVTKNYLSFQSEWRQRSWSCGISKRYFLNSRSLQRSETLLTSICGLLHKECCEAKRRNFRRFKDEREVGFWCKVDKLRIHAFVFAQRNVLNIEKDKTNWNINIIVVICVGLPNSSTASNSSRTRCKRDCQSAREPKS